MMKKWLGLALALLLLLGLFPSAGAEEAKVYQLGDQMEDFTVTLSDGTQVTLYGLLKEKKAVLINFWASWCSPCQREFPLMEQVYQEMSDDVGILALSCEKSDTDEKVLSIKQKLGLTVLPMGLDTIGLKDRFTTMGYPTSILVDRNGVVCFSGTGAITNKDKFVRLFSLFTAEDYTQSTPIQQVPMALPNVEQPAAEALLGALQAQEGLFTVEPLNDETLWPFVPSEDGAYILASNHATKESTAKLILRVTAEAGEALAFEYALSCPAVLDSLTVTVDGAQAKFFGGAIDWTSDHASFPTSGEHVVEIAFQRGAALQDDTSAMLRGLHIISAEQVAALDAQLPQRPKTLSDVSCDIEPVGDNVRPIIVTEHSQALGERQQTMAIVEGGELTLRVRIGTEVDENVAYLTDMQTATLLVNLPYDSESFLYQTKVRGLADGLLFPHAGFTVCSSAVDKENCYMKSLTCFATEADANAYVETNTQLAIANGMSDYEMSWEYADGSPKQTNATGVTETRADGKAEYRILVTDEAGGPLTGAMIQICDLTTCQVAVTDENGLVTHIATPYPYEIHLLKAPDGYAADTETYVMPETGGELTITLKKQ